MKCRIIFLLVLFTLPVLALRPGDKVGNPEFRLKWIDCTPFKIGELNKEEKKITPQLRALVFLFTRSDSSARVMQILERTRQAHRDKLLIGAVTPDTAHDAELFRKRYPDFRVRLAVDSERKLTPLFMAGSMLYPMGFIYDNDGKILWNGEAVDLPEAVELILNGKCDVDKQRKISLLLDDMQQLMRTGEHRPLQRKAEQIFKLDPANQSALRMLLFICENSGRTQDAWSVLQARIKAAPGTLRLYFTALDMMRRYPVYRKDLPQLAEMFVKNAAAPGQLIAFAEALLANFSEDISAIEAAAKVVAAEKIYSAVTPVEKAQYHLVCSRLCYLCCDMKNAEKHSRTALEIYRSCRYTPGITRAEKMLEFYQKIENLNVGKPAAAM